MKYTQRGVDGLSVTYVDGCTRISFYNYGGNTAKIKIGLAVLIKAGQPYCSSIDSTFDGHDRCKAFCSKTATTGEGYIKSLCGTGTMAIYGYTYWLVICSNGHLNLQLICVCRNHGCFCRPKVYMVFAGDSREIRTGDGNSSANGA